MGMTVGLESTDAAMSVALTEKYTALIMRLRECGPLAVAFSGGVDSALLTVVAWTVLGDGVVAVTAESPLYAKHERDEAIAMAKQIGIRHLLIESNELTVPGFADNPPNRCYLCKHELFREILDAVKGEGIERVADGTHADDSSDYRPGRRAARELGVLSPLLDAGLTKRDVRELSRYLGLPTADKPAMACLASRFPYGTRITESALHSVGAVETVLREHGVRSYRVRFHDTVCRIEVDPRDMASFAGSPAATAAVRAAKQAGFTYVTLDLEGYRTGSMNETLKEEQKHENL